METDHTLSGSWDHTEGNILVVDDNPENLRILVKLLTEAGYKVHAASKGSLALGAVERSLPDLILLDIKMSGMDGYEVCRRLKSDGRTAEVPVIFISALDDAEDKVKGFGLGCADYITKPFQFEEVLARVRTHLGFCKLKKQLHDKIRLLHHEIVERQRVEAMLQEKHDQMEQEVAQRTAELREKSRHLEEVNQALKSMLDHRDLEKRAIEDNMAVNLKKYVKPYLEQMRKTIGGEEHRTSLKIIETNLNELVVPIRNSISSKYMDLTPTEIKVADLIRQDKGSKEIAEHLNLSISTVSNFRHNIRKKLGLNNKKTNLKTYLSTLAP
ncbi:response regulator [Desulfoluna spongiiphila]|uniref:Regulatory protein, luxR family n=1 Tax=Desulfoluna spongiiphila TaxID=419481 RepID=A0A1G5C137_9BACT|nr:response regulator [Desulfoluna spongiiphila]SCX96165.1 regulatory protein, luxR family [Desulfoluna spongiiphila]VVS94045.1 transcription regulator luxr c-terminal [Desulfoluna spongiiphila]